MKDFRHRFGVEWAWFPFNMLNGIKTFHRIRFDHSMVNEPAIKGTQGTVMSSARGCTQMLKAGKKCLNGFLPKPVADQQAQLGQTGANHAHTI
ncbi:MAG: hypothetical protein NVSMB27_13440 [Ktedonobacteraceae bacterium]